jgi:protein TonB
VRHRPPVATLLASLAAHGGAVALLFFLVSGESHPSVLFIDLETLAEREAPVAAAAPHLAPAGGATTRAPVGSARPAGRDAARSGPAGPPAPALPSPVVSAAPPEPERAPERDATEAPPEMPRQPEPAAIVPAREAAPDIAARSEASVSPAEPGANRGGAAGERAAAAPEQSGGRGGASEAGVLQGPGGARGGTTVASGGPAGGAPGAEYGGYLNRMRRRLMEALRYPPPARSRGLSGTVLLDISIGSNGAIGDVSVTRSSSHPLLDEAALEAARSLAPQPFPKGLTPRPLRVRLPVVFDLQ